MELPEVTWPEVIWLEITWPEEAPTGSDRKYVLRMTGFFQCFFIIRVAKCSTVVQVPWLPEVTVSHVNPKGGRVCACATGRCAISGIVGPFDRKWRYETSPCSDRRSSEGDGRRVRMRNRTLRKIRPIGAFWPEMIPPIGLPLENMGARMSALWVFSMTSASIVL